MLLESENGEVVEQIIMASQSTGLSGEYTTDGSIMNLEGGTEQVISSDGIQDLENVVTNSI